MKMSVTTKGVGGKNECISNEHSASDAKCQIMVVKVLVSMTSDKSQLVVASVYFVFASPTLELVVS
jgi:hypothetical protein